MFWASFIGFLFSYLDSRFLKAELIKIVIRKLYISLLAVSNRHFYTLLLTFSSKNIVRNQFMA